MLILHEIFPDTTLRLRMVSSLLSSIAFFLHYFYVRKNSERLCFWTRRLLGPLSLMLGIVQALPQAVLILCLLPLIFFG